MNRPEQLADAYELLAKADHYMIGIVESVTDDELTEAYQIVIGRQNSLKLKRYPNGVPIPNPRYELLNLTLDLMEHEQRRRNIL